LIFFFVLGAKSYFARVFPPLPPFTTTNNNNNNQQQTTINNHKQINQSINQINNQYNMGVTEKIKEIEDEMARTQKNKATNYHLGTLKAKLAKLKSELLIEGGSKSGPAQDNFDVARAGGEPCTLSPYSYSHSYSYSYYSYSYYSYSYSQIIITRRFMHVACRRCSRCPDWFSLCG